MVIRVKVEDIEFEVNDNNTNTEVKYNFKEIKEVLVSICDNIEKIIKEREK